jgi:hypothetical protein
MCSVVSHGWQPRPATAMTRWRQSGASLAARPSAADKEAIAPWLPFQGSRSHAAAGLLYDCPFFVPVAHGVEVMGTELPCDSRGNPTAGCFAPGSRPSSDHTRPPRDTVHQNHPGSQGCFTIKALGVHDVAFSKSRGLAITDMVKSSWVYCKLKRFRAGIESIISFLKRCFGWDRCTWRSLESFKSYTWTSVVAANLFVLARHALR